VADFPRPLILVTHILDLSLLRFRFFFSRLVLERDYFWSVLFFVVRVVFGYHGVGCFHGLFFSAAKGLPRPSLLTSLSFLNCSGLLLLFFFFPCCFSTHEHCACFSSVSLLLCLLGLRPAAKPHSAPAFASALHTFSTPHPPPSIPIWQSLFPTLHSTAVFLGI